MEKVTGMEEFRQQKILRGFQQARKPAEVHQLPPPKRPKLVKQTWFCSCGKENSEDMLECWKCDKPRPVY